MSAAPQFLVIDFHAESRFLLVKTLLRKFPGATIHETEDANKAAEIVRTSELVAVITHRTFDLVGVELVKRLRDADPDVLIVMVSGMDRAAEALAAGANAFLPYDEWLRIGAVVESLWQRKRTSDANGRAPSEAEPVSGRAARGRPETLISRD